VPDGQRSDDIALYDCRPATLFGTLPAMAKSESRDTHDLAWLIGGIAAGAVFRYYLHHWWPAPAQSLAVTLITAAAAFLLLGFLLASPTMAELRALVAGFTGATVSLSAYVVAGITHTGWVGFAFLILTPITLVVALAVGARLGLMITAHRWPPPDRAE
jgi:hypothetical protein